MGRVIGVDFVATALLALQEGRCPDCGMPTDGDESCDCYCPICDEAGCDGSCEYEDSDD